MHQAYLRCPKELRSKEIRHNGSEAFAQSEWVTQWSCKDGGFNEKMHPNFEYGDRMTTVPNESMLFQFTMFDNFLELGRLI